MIGLKFQKDLSARTNVIAKKPLCLHMDDVNDNDHIPSNFWVHITIEISQELYMLTIFLQDHKVNLREDLTNTIPAKLGSHW